MRHLSEQNSNFGDARSINTENAPTDLYIYLFGAKFVETIDSTAVQQTVVTLRRAVSFKSIKQSQKCFKIDSAKLQKQQYITSPNKVKQKTKYLTI